MKIAANFYGTEALLVTSLCVEFNLPRRGTIPFSDTYAGKVGNEKLIFGKMVVKTPTEVDLVKVVSRDHVLIRYTPMERKQDENSDERRRT